MESNLLWSFHCSQGQGPAAWLTEEKGLAVSRNQVIVSLKSTGDKAEKKNPEG